MTLAVVAVLLLTLVQGVGGGFVGVWLWALCVGLPHKDSAVFRGLTLAAAVGLLAGLLASYASSFFY